MFGFALGTVCLALLFTTRPHRTHRPLWGSRRRAVARWLGIRPEQRAPLDDALAHLEGEALDLRRALASEREGVAAALEADALDLRAMEDMWTRASVQLSERRDALLTAVAEVHAVLDPSQRRKLARIVGRGPRHHGRHLGAYRAWA